MTGKETCPKCGVTFAAFNCDAPGCPVNGGIATGPEPGADWPAHERQAHEIVTLWFREGSNSLIRLEELIADALMSPAILEYMQERLSLLREDLDEAKQYGVNTPGFNQTLGALDELQLLIQFVNDQPA